VVFNRRTRGGRTDGWKEAPQLFKLALAGWALAGLGGGLLLVTVGHLRVPLEPLALAGSAENRSTMQPILFGSNDGLVVNYIKPDKTVAFDFMIGQLKAAMERSRQSPLCEQAAGWKVVRTSESGPDGTAVYVFAVDPRLRNVDYRVSTVVAEAIHRNPDEFYRRLLDLYAAGQNVIAVSAVWPARALEVAPIDAKHLQ
jgi:hypothetical protein